MTKKKSAPKKEKCPKNLSEALEAAYKIIMKGKKTNRGRISVDEVLFHDPKDPSQKFRMQWINENEKVPQKGPREYCIHKGCRVIKIR
jgi:hypothetical protein